MSCCPACGCGRPMCTCKYAPWLLRIAFGLILVGYGVNHYRFLDGFIAMTKGAYATVPLLASIAGVLAYIVPALMIVGGVLFAVKQLCCVSKTCIYAALGGIIGWASLAVLVGDVNAGGAMMPLIQNAAVLLVLYWVVKKMTKCCCSGGACGGKCACGPSCNCGPSSK